MVTRESPSQTLPSSLYLASASPRRAELLRQLGLQFEPLVLEVDESSLVNEPVSDLVVRLAKLKAEAGWNAPQRQHDWPVLAADTLVCCQGQILGKPKSNEQAVEMLSWLSGREQQVLTAVAVRRSTGLYQKLQISHLKFRSLTKLEIVDYVQRGESLDKAGGYGIQGFAGCFVAQLQGSYSGVMGLPLAETYELLVGTSA